MQKLTSVSRKICDGWVKVGLKSGLMLLAVLAVNAGSIARAQFTFETAQDLGNAEWGTVTNDNISAIGGETGDPSIAGFGYFAPLWYKWTAPHGGDVELDTIPSVILITNITLIDPSGPTYATNVTTVNMDTVLGVYQGTSPKYLNQIAANDDLFPINQNLSVGTISPNADNTSSAFFDQRYFGPSHLRFTAKGGQTYYFAVDTKGQLGTVSLNWAYKSSGVFRFATEDVDRTTLLPLFQTAESESQLPQGSGNADEASPVLTYYNYNVPGVLVTVTRTAGSVGRALVDYTVLDGSNLPAISPQDQPAHSFPSTETHSELALFGTNGVFGTNIFTYNRSADYIPISGTLIFDDFEMSKTFFVPINYQFAPWDQSNRVFEVQLSNPRLDAFESPDGSVSSPRIDPAFSNAVVRILNTDGDPWGPDLVPVIHTNVVFGSDTTNYIAFKNYVTAMAPTNLIFNFEKANFRVPADVCDSGNANYFWANVTLYVERGGTNTQGATVNYRVDSYLNQYSGAHQWNNEFPLQPGSDYAVPLPDNQDSTVRNYNLTNYDRVSNNYDFDRADGSITFPGGNTVGNFYQPIHINIPISKATKFNKDFRISLYRDYTLGNTTVHRITGNNAECTVTILFNDENPPAGSVDELYNADLNGDLALYPGSGGVPSRVPDTSPENNENPGVGSPASPGQVYGIAALSNGKALVVGDFPTYNGWSHLGIVLVNTNGQEDTSFARNTGVSGDIIQEDSPPDPKINAVTASGNQFYIGGSFTAYNNTSLGCVARVNTDGSLDTNFDTGYGANGMVRAIAMMTNGEVLIGGDFTQVNHITRNHIALLKTDGQVDTSFDPGNTINGSVYSIALPIPSVTFSNLSSSLAEADQTVRFGAADAGLLTMNFASTAVDDIMRIYYGDTNVTAGSGVLIYSVTNPPPNFSLPFSPTGGLTTNVITVVMNPGGALSSRTWNYSGTISFPNSGSGIMVAGEFSVNGQSFANIARLNYDGSLDTTFIPGTGVDNIVHTVNIEQDGKILAGGEFTHANGISCNHIVRFNANGSTDTNFFIGSGANDIVYTIAPQYDGDIYVGGAFSQFNGTRRSRFARLYYNGTVDTTFMDTAYNQFAGLKKIYSYDSPAIFAAAAQINNSDYTGILIGGSFLQVGGGQVDPNVANSLDEELLWPYYGGGDSFGDAYPNGYLWAEPKSRDGFRNRTSFARLIGGSTPGPGNIVMDPSGYSRGKSQNTMPVSLIRTNGALGAISANFSVQPGLAQPGQDYNYQSAPPLYWVGYDYLTRPTRMREDGLWGVGGFLRDALGDNLPQADDVINNLSKVTVNVIANQANPGNLNAQFQLANPSLSETFYLGSQPIPLGAALGSASSPFTLIDDISSPGQFGFKTGSFVATNSPTPVTIVRSNGSFGIVTMLLNTIASNSTAIVGQDYVGITNRLVSFNQGILSTNASLTIKNTGTAGNVEKTVWLRLSPFTTGTTWGITNAIVRIIDPNSVGYVTLSTNSYLGSINSGVLNFTVNRIIGSSGTVSVQYATTNGPSATNGMDFIGTTNTLTWNSGDVTPRTISIPLLNPGIVGGIKQFGIKLFNPTNNGVAAPSIMGIISNAVCTITNDNNYGTLQFSAPFYNVNENGDYATITVTRTSGQAGTVTANYATSDGSNTVAGVNYYATNGTVTFVPNQTVTSFRVYLKNDGVKITNSIFFNVTLSNPNNATLGSPTNTQVRILDAEYYSGQLPGSPDTDFNPDGMDGNVLALSLNSSGQILAGGNFQYVGSTAEGHVARLNTDGSLDSSFLNGLSGANAAVNALVAQTTLPDADRILIGGAFTMVNTYTRYFVARLMTDGTVDTSFNPGAGADNVVNAIAETFVSGNTNLIRKIYIGGAFSSFNGNLSPGIERLNNDGSVDYGFSIGSGANGQVYTIAVYPTNSIYWGKVLVGGGFTNFNGVTVGNLVRLNADGSVDTNFVSALGFGASDAVHALAIQLDGKVLVGGSFTNFNGNSVNRILRLNTDGSVDSSFIAAGPNGTVEAIAIQPDNRILVSGQFTSFNGVTRNRITRMMPDGTTDPTINFGTGANGDVDALLVQPNDGGIVLGGAFSQFNDLPYSHIARIYGGSVTGSGAFKFNTSDYYVNENGIAAPITILRTGGTSGTNSDGSGDIFVQFSTSDGTAVNGINYLGQTNIVDFPAGEVEKTVVVPVLEDFVITPDLTVNLALSNLTPPATNGVQTTATLHIVNVDSAVSFSSESYSQNKNGQLGIDIVRTGSTDGTASVDYSTTTTGTAVIGTDYYPTNGTVTFNPGVSDVQIEVPIINNGLPEGNKTVGLMLTNAVNTQLTAPSNAVLTILDNVTAPGQFFFDSANYSVSMADGTATLTVLRTNGWSGSINVYYNTIPGTAKPNVDYTPSAPPDNFVTFNDQEASKTISIPLLANNLVEGQVYFSVVLSNATGGGTLTAPSAATVAILNTNVGFAFQNATNYFREFNGTVPIVVQRIGGTNGGVSVSFSTINNGTAQAGVNYTPVSGTVTFAANETPKTISLPLLYDPRVTGDLTLGIKLSNPSSGTFVVYPSNEVVVIQDADAGLSFTNSTMSVDKDVGNAVITVVCSNPSVEPLRVNYSTADGTAVAGIDYTATSGTLSFSNGIGTNTFSVPIINNSLVTGSHAFSVNLSNPTAPGQLVAPSNLVVTIVDNNSGLSFSRPAYTVLKTGVSTNITVVRTDNTNQISSVNFATVNGSALAGTDYIATNGTLTFNNGDVSKSFTVTVIANTTVQPDKTVLLQLSSPSNAFLIAPYAATLTIHDTSGSLVVPAGSTLLHESLITNGIIDPNENVTMLLALRASGGTNIPNVNATLLVTNGITSPLPATSVNYGALTVGGPAVSRQFSFTANGTNGQQVVATLLLDNGVTNIGTAGFSYTLGMWTNIFVNTNRITIPDPIYTTGAGIASPYPSIITVSNLGGTLIKSVVTLSNFYHTYPNDVNALVVSPAGQDTLLMSHTGGPTNVAKITLTFDDAAATSLSGTNALTTSTNKPTHYLITPTFP